MSAPRRIPTIDQMVLRTKEPSAPSRTERDNQRLIQFWAPKVLWRQLQELANEETLARGKEVSIATILRRAARRELELKMQGLGDAA